MTNLVQKELDGYLLSEKPLVRKRAVLWKLAFGLQQVDRMTNSFYMKLTVARHIRGGISLGDVGLLLEKHYRVRKFRAAIRQILFDEPDITAQRTAELVREPLRTVTLGAMKVIHRKLCEKMHHRAGLIRKEALRKTEWALGNRPVDYDAADLEKRLMQLFLEERKFSWAGLSPEDTVRHFAQFLSAIWALQPFRQRNALTLAVFAIQYFTRLHLEPDFLFFGANAWYFRNALVRACHGVPSAGVGPNPDYLEAFLKNLLFGAQNALDPEQLRIAPEPPPAPPAERAPGRRVHGRYVPFSKEAVEEFAKALVVALDGEMTGRELKMKMGVKHRSKFDSAYFASAHALGYAEMTIPEAPRHIGQKYRLTPKGLAYRARLLGN